MPKNALCPTPHAKTIRKDKGNHLPERNAFIVTSVGRCHDEIVSSSRIELDVYIRQSKVRRGEFVITIVSIRIVVVMQVLVVLFPTSCSLQFVEATKVSKHSDELSLQMFTNHQCNVSKNLGVDKY